MRVTNRALGVTWLCAIVGGCVQTDLAPVNSEQGPTIALRVLDQSLVESERNEVPRRPQLRLERPGGLQADPAGLWLLTGAADDDLREDLSAAPLRAEHAARVVPSSLSAHDDALVLEPLTALESDSIYTMAIAGNARDGAGKRLFSNGAPWLVELRTERGAAAGARVLSTWPADGASAVPTNLAAAVIAFDGEVAGEMDGAWLEAPDGLAVPAALEIGACSALAPEHEGASCIRITPGTLLAPGAPYALVLGSTLHDAHGAPIGPYRASFRTASGPDHRAPLLRLPSCAIDERAVSVGCALIDDHAITVHVLADEPALFTLTTAVPDGQEPLVARSVGASGEALLQLSGLEPDHAYALELQLRDEADDVARERFELRSAPPLPTLSIVELRADPLGPEPAQEFVELLNYGTRPVQLQGCALGDRLDAPGTPISTEAWLQPATRALLVADGFDPQAAGDVQPPAGALLVRVGKSLASGGLRNSGEALYLRAPDGTRISAAPSTPTPRAGRCVVRIGDDPRSGAAGTFDDAGDEGCTPGW